MELGRDIRGNKNMPRLAFDTDIERGVPKGHYFKISDRGLTWAKKSTDETRIRGSAMDCDVTEEDIKRQVKYTIGYCPIVFVFSEDIDFLEEVRSYVFEHWGIPLNRSRITDKYLQLSFDWRMKKEDIKSLREYLDSLTGGV